ncbi:MAG: DUF4154 domain-containing protein [Acidobacteria bacterium]|nr:MAG: DUF4154 domain-containing protein [Acidobacteriota bacterium]
MSLQPYSAYRQAVTKTVRRIVIATLCWMAVGGEPNAYGSSPTSPEYLIKAAYIYNFAMFVEWPVDAFPQESSPIVIGIIGTDPFGPAIDQTVRDKRIDKRPLLIKRLQWGQDFRECHVLFISSSETGRSGDVLHQLRNFPILVVAESEGLSKQGAIINFFVEDNRVHYEINLDAARRAHLRISSKLLNLAKVTKGS